MSSEFDDIDAGLQRDLQPAAPSAPNGAPDGRAEPTAPELLASLPAAPLAAPDAPGDGLPARVQAALTGEPGTLPLTWCRRCAVEVVPRDKGACPRCGTFLKQNFVARRHPVNRLRRDALLAELVAEYRPTTTMLRSTCAHLAGTLEQLEVMKPGSPDWQRLVQVAQTLGAALEGSKPAARTDDPDTSNLTEDELVERVEVLLVHVRELRDAKTTDSRQGPDRAGAE